ncbi:hypothetical protein ACFWRG_32415 [Micromonospora tulbaghiae]|uniref:Uncharacterized protein n=2 Tax=Streptomyces TaxID=1883 RepID=A0A1E7LVC5_9ACTN|nr:hypothetical protein [Streptomyces nanshensis]OEV20180.1 hypothetical protein AN221_13280 [Streptomyces nanshensis]
MSNVPECAVEIPAPDEEAVKPWRKRLTGLDESQPGAMSCEGDWLEAGATYQMPVGALIVLCDPLPGGARKRVRIWRVKRDGTVKEERDSTLGSSNAFGTSVRGTLRRLISQHPPQKGAVHQTTAAAPRVNERDGTCSQCRQPIPARAGILERNHRGYMDPRHRPGQCPPPPPRTNDYAQACGLCGGWLEAGLGVLYTAVPALGVYGKPLIKARHAQDCPPPEERISPPPPAPRANAREQDCRLCGNTVPAGAGLLERYGAAWEVRHPDGACPPKEELWEITRGEPGRFHPRPERWAPPGTVLRSTVYDHDQPFPKHTPGLRRLRTGEVSAIVATVRERAPEYCRDEDGNNPGCLIGEDGWFFRILVRPATPEEAADLLAAEDTAHRRAALAERRRQLFEHAADGEIPDTADLAGTVQVDFGARRSLHQHWPDDELHVDEESGSAWFLRYNGADGDTWSANNLGSFIARRMPLTEQRAQLIADLRAEYPASG